MLNRKGIILAGGTGSRLKPLTNVVSKQLLPIYSKPTIYYPLATIMTAGIREILIISTPEDTPKMEELFGDGSRFGINISYKVQSEPKGLAEAYILAEEFLDGCPSMMVLGDNLIYSSDLKQTLGVANAIDASTIFGYEVSNPRAYGVVEFDRIGSVISLEEKPENPKSNFAIPGIYFFDSDATLIAKSLQPSARGELEIVDIQREYLKRGTLLAMELPRGTAWLDSGTHDSLLEAAQFVQAIEVRQGIMICCPEEIAFENKWITEKQIAEDIKGQGQNIYTTYLKKLISKKNK
jgi:glucose-1-phosphate thymidylyltransferase